MWLFPRPKGHALKPQGIRAVCQTSYYRGMPFWPCRTVVKDNGWDHSVESREPSAFHVLCDIGLILCVTSVSVERCVMAEIGLFFKPTASNLECARHSEEPHPKRIRMQSSRPMARCLPTPVSMLLVISEIGGANFRGFSRWRETEVCLECCGHCVIDIIQRTRATCPQSEVWHPAYAFPKTVSDDTQAVTSMQLPPSWRRFVLNSSD